MEMCRFQRSSRHLNPLNKSICLGPETTRRLASIGFTLPSLSQPILSVPPPPLAQQSYKSIPSRFFDVPFSNHKVPHTFVANTGILHLPPRGLWELFLRLRGTQIIWGIVSSTYGFISYGVLDQPNSVVLTCNTHKKLNNVIIIPFYMTYINMIILLYFRFRKAVKFIDPTLLKIYV